MSEESLSKNSSGMVVGNDECLLAFPKTIMGFNEADENRSAMVDTLERYEIRFLLPSGTFSDQFYLVFHGLFSCFDKSRQVSERKCRAARKTKLTAVLFALTSGGKYDMQFFALGISFIRSFICRLYVCL